MLPVTAPPTAQQHGLPARVREGLSELAALPGSSDALVMRMARANVGGNMGTAEVAERLDMASAAVSNVAGLTPYDRVSGGTVALYLRPDVEAAAQRLDGYRKRRDIGAAARQAEAAYLVEAAARRREALRTRRDERAAAREAGRADRQLTIVPPSAPTGTWMA